VSNNSLLVTLPHKKPILFVDEVTKSLELEAKTNVLFDYTPTLSMLVESAAQSSAFVKLTEAKTKAGIPLDCSEGMLIGLKKVKQLKEVTSKTLQISIQYSGNLQNFFSFNFEVFEKEIKVCNGVLNIIMTCTEKENDD